MSKLILQYGTTRMGLYETEARFYKKQFRFFQPEPKYFLTIPVLVETLPEFQLLILFPAKPGPEIDFCQNSWQNMPKFDRVFCGKKVNTI